MISKNTTTPILFLLVSAADGYTGVGGVSPVVTIAKPGGTLTAAAGSVSEVGNGVYRYTPTIDETNTTGQLLLHATGAGAVPVDVLVTVVDEWAKPADVQSIAGDGDVPIDHNTGGSDALRIVSEGVGVDDVVITAYLKSDYNAGVRIRRGWATTDATGRWKQPMMLDAGAYILVAEKPGVFTPDAKELVVE